MYADSNLAEPRERRACPVELITLVSLKYSQTSTQPTSIHRHPRTAPTKASEQKSLLQFQSESSGNGWPPLAVTGDNIKMAGTYQGSQVLAGSEHLTSRVFVRPLLRVVSRSGLTQHGTMSYAWAGLPP